MTRPETALPVNASAPNRAGSHGRARARLRTSRSASSPAETVPAMIIVVRTPRVAMTYGDRAL